MNAIEYGEVVQKDGKWMFKNTEDPVFKLMRDTGWITNERYFQVFERTGQNWIEPADALLNRRRQIEWNRYLKTGLHLPDWIDLGLEQRTRFESYDHPWRSSQSDRKRADGCANSYAIETPFRAWRESSR